MDVAESILHHSLRLALRDDSDQSSGAHDGHGPGGNSTSSGDSTGSSDSSGRPPVYKVVGICLAVASGLFIGVSFVIKKIGLLKANAKYNEEAGEGYGYLKNAWWWTGMTLMIVGEICNFVAYAFTDAILVTPLGALSVVVTTILSAIFLKERLSFVGKVSCAICILGSVVIVLNAPEQAAVKDIQEMQHFVIAPGFLSYTAVIIISCICVIFFVAPRWGKKSMLVYLTVCSLIGGLSVVATQGLGAAILAQVNGESEFTQWFLYVLFCFVIGTLVTEIIYLNVSSGMSLNTDLEMRANVILQKALNLFNAALVTPTYYVYFTSSTIVASAVLFQGFHGSVIQIVDVVIGFLIICSGVILLQLAKSSKDVPDAAVFKGDLDQVRTVAEQEEPEYEPRADTIRGGAGIVRAMSRIRTKRQADEARRIYQERMEPIGEGEEFEWDGLRRRRTMSTTRSGSIQRTKSVHPPLGMSHFPTDDGEEDVHPGFFARLGRKSTLGSQQQKRQGQDPVPLETVHGEPNKLDPEAGGSYAYAQLPSLQKVDEQEDTSYRGAAHIQFAGDVHDSRRDVSSQGSSPAPPKPPPHASGTTGESSTKRQFSFQNVFHRKRSDNADDRPTSRGALSFISGRSGSGHSGSRDHSYPGTQGDRATEEERLGLVHGDSSKTLPKYSELEMGEEPEQERDSDEWQVTSGTSNSSPQDLGASGDLARQRRRDPYDGDDDDYMMSP